MNGLDIAILVVFFVSALIGAMRGFTKELLSLFSWGGAIALSYIFLPIARGFVHPYIANPMMGDGAGFFCLFIGFLIILSIMANIIAGYIHETSFRGVDHSLGFGFGMLRGIVLISAVELLVSTFWPRHTQSATIQTARFIPMARKGGDTLLQILPVSARAWILEQAVKVENQVSSKVHDQLKNAAPQIFSEGGPKEVSGGSVPGAGVGPGGPGYEGAAPSLNHPPAGQPPLQQPLANMPMRMQGSSQGIQPQGGQIQSPMVVIRPPQPGQMPQLAPAPGSAPAVNSMVQGGSVAPQPGGLRQSAMPRDTQATVDELARLKPQSTPKEDSGYTRGQRDDMNRLFQAADGE